jgi:hypothetical protein
MNTQVKDETLTNEEAQKWVPTDEDRDLQKRFRELMERPHLSLMTVCIHLHEFFDAIEEQTTTMKAKGIVRTAFSYCFSERL